MRGIGVQACQVGRLVMEVTSDGRLPSLWHGTTISLCLGWTIRRLFQEFQLNYNFYQALEFSSLSLCTLTMCVVIMGFPGSLVVKNLPANAGDVRDVGSIAGSGRPLEEYMATNSNIHLENPMDRVAIGSQRIGHDWSDLAHMHTHTFNINLHNCNLAYLTWLCITSAGSVLCCLHLCIFWVCFCLFSFTVRSYFSRTSSR